MAADKQQYASIIWGPTCHGADCVVRDCLLPEMNIGDWLIFRDMGAYTMTLSSCFNGMPKPNCFYVLSEEDWYVRRVLFFQ